MNATAGRRRSIGGGAALVAAALAAMPGPAAAQEPLRSRIAVLIDSSQSMLHTPQVVRYTGSCTTWNPCSFNGNPSPSQESCNACVIDTINFDPVCATNWDARCRQEYTSCLANVTGQTTCSPTMAVDGGVATRGDGSADLPGCDLDGNGKADDSRIYQAKQAVNTVVAAAPNVEFALWRYRQVTGGQTCTTDSQCPSTPGGTRLLTCEDHDNDPATARVCAFDADLYDATTSPGFEGQCNRFTHTGSPATFSCDACDFQTTYDRASCMMFDLDRVRTSAVSPLNGTSSVSCFPLTNPSHRFVRYQGARLTAGACDPSGGDRLVDFPASGFDSNASAIASWLDHTQVPFSSANELRAQGLATLAAGLRDMRTALLASLATDAGAPSRDYKLVVITDGSDDSCEPAANAQAAAAALQNLSFTTASGETVTDFAIPVHVIWVGSCSGNPVCAARRANVDALAGAGGTATALVARSELEIGIALAGLTGLPVGAPEVITQPATEIGTDRARLHATVYPAGSRTLVSFDYGTTTAYGLFVPGPDIPAGVVPVDVSSSVGLQCGTEYHFRAHAANLTGTSYGLDQTLTTLACPGPPITLASDINPSSFGQAVTFTATLSASSGIPTGTVTFSSGSATLGTATLAGGVATLTISTLAVGDHTITAAYSGDDTFSGSTSSALTQRVNQAATTTTLTSPVNPSTFGQPVLLTVTVTSAGGTPPGSVTLTVGTFTQTQALNTAGTAGFVVQALGVGQHPVGAAYSGNGDFAASAADLVQTVERAPTSTSVTSSPNPSRFGQGVTFALTVSSGAGTPTGSVQLEIGTVPPTMVALSLDAGGHASFATPALAVGHYAVQAVYGGDGSFAGGTSGPVSHTVEKANTEVSLASSTNPSSFGQPVTFTATVTSDGGVPTGAVAFVSGTTPLGTGTLAGARATFTTSALAAGSHSITAVYGGDDSFSGNASTGLSQAVERAGTSTGLTSSMNPSTFGQSVTFTVGVTSAAGTPTGVVALLDGTTALGMGPLVSGSVAFTTSMLTVGSHAITAVYAGDATFYGGTSPDLAQTVERAGTSTGLTSSMNPATYGQPVTFTATVASSAGIPSGTVKFLDGATELGTATLAAAHATLTTSGLGVGDHSITAVYAGDLTFAGSTSPGVAQTVTAIANATHDVGENKFKTEKNIHLAKDGHGPFPIEIEVRNFGTATESIFYGVSSTESVALSPACSGLVPMVPAKSSVAVPGCTVTYPETELETVLTLTVSHDAADGGTDSKTSNDTRQVAIKLKR